MTKEETYDLAYRLSQHIAGQYGADPEELAKHATAIARVESSFRPNAVNKHSTARGLMQMLICTQRDVESRLIGIDPAPAMHNCKSMPAEVVSKSKDRLLWDPEYAMMLALHYLGYQYQRYGDWQKAVHAYNQGSYPANKADGAKYAAKVFKNIDIPLNEPEYTQGGYLIAGVYNTDRIAYY